MSEVQPGDALRALQEASAAYEEARAACARAQTDECNALNRLNEAQRAFDKTIAEIREMNAHPDSDWGRLKSST